MLPDVTDSYMSMSCYYFIFDAKFKNQIYVKLEKCKLYIFQSNRNGITECNNNFEIIFFNSLMVVALVAESGLKLYNFAHFN